MSDKYTEEWLLKQIEKDKKQIENHKKKLIKEIKSIDKEKMLDTIKKSKEKKETFLDKILKLFY
jgi:hypothetical protein